MQRIDELQNSKSSQKENIHKTAEVKDEKKKWKIMSEKDLAKTNVSIVRKNGIRRTTIHNLK